MLRPLVNCLLIIIAGDCSNVASNDVLPLLLTEGRKSGSGKVKVYWNVPTFQCDYHKLNFTGLAEKYDMIQNGNDRFWGGNISILYDPGAFPAILQTEDGRTVLRNGGVPQNGNLSYHLRLFEDFLEALIPDPDFAGLGVIDFESWRPIFRQNFGSLTAYKNLSVDLARKAHPNWPETMVMKEAVKKFEINGRQFMEETLFLAKKLRPKAQWGYYAYPYCFNMSPSNMKTQCPRAVIRENDRTDWLFKMTDNLHPSLYLPENRLNIEEKLEMIEGRMDEARRIKIGLSEEAKIVPYFWFKYSDTRNFVSKEDLFKSFLVLSTSQIDGLIIWGSSSDVNSRLKCLDLFNYVDDVLGPALINNFN